MSDPRSCPQCGAVLPSDAPDGLCPKCLLQLGFDSQAARAAEDARSATVYRPRFLPPSITELAAHFPQLEVLEQIGHGGMGVVYKARQRDLDRVVALKILRPDIESDPAFAERFVREARALAKLSHPAIVTVHDFGRKDSLYYFVMEYIDGTNLRDLERSGRLTPQQALVIVPRICEALQYAHDQGVVHRDIKPENILIDKGGRVKIADFGLAKVLGTAPDAGTLTGAWQVMGTPHYMAPEQMQGAHQVDHRADIYSLGVVIYEMLTGELPVGRFPLPSQKVQVDVRLDDVVLRTLEREPARRYQHASDVKTDVESISSVSQPKPLPVPAGSPSADRGGGALPGGSPDRSAAAREIVQGPADAMMLAGGAALLTAIGVAIWLWLKWNDVVLQPNTRFGLTLMSVTHTVYGLFMIANGWLMRRLRLRVVVLLCAVLVGLFVPAVLALNVIMELPRIPEWPVGIPIWLGMPVALWAMIALFRRDVRAAFAEHANVSRAQSAARPADQRVKVPAILLLLTGLLFALQGVLLLILASLFFGGHQFSQGELVLLACLGAALLAAGSIVCRGAWQMLQLRGYRWALAAAILGQPLGIWPFVVLLRRDVKAAFDRRQAVALTAADASEARVVDVDAARRAAAHALVSRPATTLIAVGVFEWIACWIACLVFGIVAATSGPDVPAMFGSRETLELLLPVVGLLGGFLSGVVILAGLKMQRLESRGFAMFGSALAAFISPGNVIGLPVALWCLYVLTRPDVRAAFRDAQSARRDDRSLPGGEGAKPWQKLARRWPRAVQTVLHLLYLAGFVLFFSFTSTGSGGRRVQEMKYSIGTPVPWYEFDFKDAQSTGAVFNLLSPAWLIGAAAFGALYLASLVRIPGREAMSRWDRPRTHAVVWAFAGLFGAGLGPVVLLAQLGGSGGSRQSGALLKGGDPSVVVGTGGAAPSQPAAESLKLAPWQVAGMDTVLTDDARIQGDWTFVSYVSDGKLVDPEDLPFWKQTFLANGTYTAQLGDSWSETGTYTLDPTKTPKTIDAVVTDGPARGHAIAGIYEFDGDTLKVCWSPYGSLEHPGEFSAPAASGRDLFLLRRSKPRASASADASAADASLDGPTWEEFYTEVRLPMSAPAPTHVAYSADGRKLLALVGDDLHAWAHNGALTSLGRKPVPNILSGAGSVSLTYGGDVLTVVREGGTVELWDLAAGQRVSQLDSGAARCAACAPGRELVAVAGEDAAVTLWDVESKSEWRRLESPVRVTALAFSVDGALLAGACADGNVALWDVASGDALVSFRGLTAEPLCVAFAPDGERLAAGTQDGTVAVWHIPTGRLESTLKAESGLSSLAFSPRGWHLAVGNMNGTIQRCLRFPATEDAPLPLGPGRVHALRVGHVPVVGDDPYLSLAVQGDYAYMIQGNVVQPKRLHVVDISDPSQPRFVGACPVADDAANLAVSGDHVCVLDDPHLRVIDVSDPSTPRTVGMCELGEHLWDLAVQGEYAYVTDIVSVRVIDLSDPAAPREVGRCDLEEAQGITVAGEFAYVACDIEGMHVLDVSDPTTPREIGVFDGPQGAADVVVDGNHAYVAGGEDAVTLRIADISDPRGPRSLGRYGDWIVGSVAVQGGCAFLGGDIVEVSNPAAPVRVGSYAGWDAVVAGDYAYVADEGGFAILRIVRSGKRTDGP